MATTPSATGVQAAAAAAAPHLHAHDFQTGDAMCCAKAIASVQFVYPDPRLYNRAMADVNILQLPRVLLQHGILTLLTPRDVVSFGVTCKAAASVALHDDQAVWKPRWSEAVGSPSCNITPCNWEPDAWECSSYRELYLKVLHPYSHLLGLWAVLDTCYGGLVVVKPHPSAGRLKSHIVLINSLMAKVHMFPMWSPISPLHDSSSKASQRTSDTHTLPAGSSATGPQTGDTHASSTNEQGQAQLLQQDLRLDFLFKEEGFSSTRGELKWHHGQFAQPQLPAGFSLTGSHLHSNSDGPPAWRLAHVLAPGNVRHIYMLTSFRMNMGLGMAPGMGIPDAPTTCSTPGVNGNEEPYRGSSSVSRPACTCQFPEVDFSSMAWHRARMSADQDSAWTSRGGPSGQGLSHLQDFKRELYAQLPVTAHLPHAHPLEGLWRGTYGGHCIEVLWITSVYAEPSSQQHGKHQQPQQTEQDQATAASLDVASPAMVYGTSGSTLMQGQGTTGASMSGTAGLSASQGAAAGATMSGTTDTLTSQGAVAGASMSGTTGTSASQGAAAGSSQQAEERASGTPARKLCAIKLVGDPNVPAGAISLQIYVDGPPPQHPIARPGEVFRCPEGFHTLVKMGHAAAAADGSTLTDPPLIVRGVHSGLGQIAGHGFSQPSWTPQDIYTFHSQCELHGHTLPTPSGAATGAGVDTGAGSLEDVPVQCFGVLWHELHSFSLFTRLHPDQL